MLSMQSSSIAKPRGGTVRHDAVAWGYARGAGQRGVDIIQDCAVTAIRREAERVVVRIVDEALGGAGARLQF